MKILKGWDSEQKLSIVKEAMGFGNSEVPMLAQQVEPQLPFTYKSVEREIEAEDEQAFLNRLSTMVLDGPVTAGGGAQSPRRDNSKAPGDNNTMLANFFSSLLTKEIRQFLAISMPNYFI